MKVKITWREKSRGGGLVGGSYVSPSMITFWFHISRTRVGERVYYLSLMTLLNGKLKSEKICQIPTNKSAAEVAKLSKEFITKFVKENKGVYNVYN